MVKTDFADPDSNQSFKFSLGYYRTTQNPHKNGHYAFATQETDSEPYGWIKSIKVYRDEKQEFEQFIIEIIDLNHSEFGDGLDRKPG